MLILVLTEEMVTLVQDGIRKALEGLTFYSPSQSCGDEIADR
jgi:hypothetical protein